MRSLADEIVEIVNARGSITLRKLCKILKRKKKDVYHTIVHLHNGHFIVFENGRLKKIKEGETNKHKLSPNKSLFDLSFLHFSMNSSLIILVIILLPILPFILFKTYNWGNSVYDVFTGTYEINKDYWFVSKYEIQTKDGQIFYLNKLKDVEVNATVLGVKSYKNDLTKFSPKDIVLGWGDIEEGRSMDILMVHERFAEIMEGREGVYKFPVYSYITQFDTIPSDERTYDLIKEIKVNDVVTIKGEMVSVRNGKLFTGTWGEYSEVGTDDVYEVVLVTDIIFSEEEQS